MNDLLKRPRFHRQNGRFYLSVEALVEAGLKSGSIKELISRGSYHFIPDEEDRRCVWIDWEALPKSTKTKADAAHGDAETAFQKQEILVAVARLEWAHGAADKEKFMVYRVREGGRTAFSASEARGLTRACAWLRLCADADQRRRMGWAGKLAFFALVAPMVKAENLFGLRVGNPRKLDERVEAWTAAEHDSLVSKKHGNANAAKLSPLAIDRIVALAALPTKPTAVAIAGQLEKEAERLGCLPVTATRVAQVMAAREHVWFAARHGRNEGAARFDAHLKRRRASRPDALWDMDGTNVQLLWRDETGRVRGDLYIAVVTDAHSDAVIGWALGATETTELAMAALRSAARHGWQPEQLRYDNGSAFKAGAMQAACDSLAATCHFPSAPYNAKAKRIEGILGRIEREIMRIFPNYKGGNITTKSLQSKANKDHVAELLKNRPDEAGALGGLPDAAQVRAQIELIIELWNAGANKGRAPRRTLYEAAHADRKPLAAALKIEALWPARQHPATYGAHGLRLEIGGLRRDFAVQTEPGLEDAAFRKQWLGDRFAIRWNPENGDEIALFEEKTGRFVALAAAKYEFAEAVIDRPDGEGALLSEAISLRKARRAADRLALKASEGRVLDAGFELIDPRIMGKDAMNWAENRALDDELGIPSPAVPMRHALYGIEEASNLPLD